MFRYRLYPNRAQERLILQQFEIHCSAYNSLLQICRQRYREHNGAPRKFDLDKDLMALKRADGRFSTVHSQTLQNVCKRLALAFLYFERKRRPCGFPRMKPLHRYRSITFPQSGFSVVEDNVRVWKLGKIKTVFHRPLEGKIKTFTIKRTAAGRWYAIFCCDMGPASADVGSAAPIGIDVGLSRFAALSDGTWVASPRFYHEAQERLALLQRRLSRKRSGSKGRQRAQLRLARLQEHIHDQRTDFLHKLSTGIIQKHPTVAVEDLSIFSLGRSSFSKAVHDASWGRFLKMLDYKASRAGGRVLRVDPRGTTQECSKCRSAVRKTLKDRLHQCWKCGFEADRDLNAALNILQRALGTAGTAGNNASGDDASTRQGHASSMNEEAAHMTG